MNNKHNNLNCLSQILLTADLLQQVVPWAQTHDLLGVRQAYYPLHNGIWNYVKWGFEFISCCKLFQWQLMTSGSTLPYWAKKYMISLRRFVDFKHYCLESEISNNKCWFNLDLIFISVYSLPCLALNKCSFYSNSSAVAPCVTASKCKPLFFIFISGTSGGLSQRPPRPPGAHLFPQTLEHWACCRFQQMAEGRLELQTFSWTK